MIREVTAKCSTLSLPAAAAANDDDADGVLPTLDQVVQLLTYICWREGWFASQHAGSLQHVVTAVTLTLPHHNHSQSSGINPHASISLITICFWIWFMFLSFHFHSKHFHFFFVCC